MLSVHFLMVGWLYPSFVTRWVMSSPGARQSLVLGLRYLTWFPSMPWSLTSMARSLALIRRDALRLSLQKSLIPMNSYTCIGLFELNHVLFLRESYLTVSTCRLTCKYLWWLAVLQVLDLTGQVTHGNIPVQIPVLHFLPQVPATQIQVDLQVDLCYALHSPIHEI